MSNKFTIAKDFKRIFRKLDPVTQILVILGLGIIYGIHQYLIDSHQSDAELDQSIELVENNQQILGENDIGTLLVQPPLDQLELAKVSRVIDGDTFILESGDRVRMIGIDTPETVHPNKQVECGGSQASQFVTELLTNQEVYLETDISNTDRFGRLLRYVWIQDLMVNQILLRQGLAQVSSYPPDIKYQENFVNDQEIAREAQLGLWSDQCLDFGSVTE